jgi:hypothetical protein
MGRARIAIRWIAAVLNGLGFLNILFVAFWLSRAHLRLVGHAGPLLGLCAGTLLVTALALGRPGRAALRIPALVLNVTLTVVALWLRLAAPQSPGGMVGASLLVALFPLANLAVLVTCGGSAGAKVGPAQPPAPPGVTTAR